MPMGTNQGWYDTNETRRFPLGDNVTALATDGVSVLPDDFIVDLILSAPTSLDPAAFYVSRVRGVGAGVIITIAAAGADVATAWVSSAHARFASYAVTSLTAAGVVGRVVIGTETAVSTMSRGDVVFTAAAAGIVVTAIRPRITGVDSLTVRNSDGRSFSVTGAVTLSAGKNTTLSVDGQAVKVGVAGGVVYDNAYGCNTDAAGKVALMSINGVAPDGSGNINIVGIGCVTVATGVASLTLDDKCAKPCCGCEELDVIKTGEASLKDAMNALTVLMSNLQNKISSLETSFSRSGVPT